MAEVTLLEALKSLAHELVERLDADAAILSRVVGDVLLIVARTTSDEQELSTGHGFLISDYPPTKHVVETGRPTVLTLADPDVDPGEASVLEELGYATLLMLPLIVGDATWGLVEVYRADVRTFSADEIGRARALARIA